MRLCRDGVEDAYGVIYERHRARVLRFATGITRDEDAAQDVVQQAFAYIFRKVEEYEPRARFTTYLFRVARNMALDVVRRQVRRGGSVSLEAVLEPAGNAPGPGAAVERREDLARVFSALEALDEPHRSVVELRVLEGLPVGQVAETLGVPEGTVKSRLHNALEKLRRALGVEVVS